jgi:hypothetical protein
MAKAQKNKKKTNIDPRQLEIGDVVAIEWYDVHAYERIEISEIDALEDPGTTRCWGVVLKKSKKYLFIASELGDVDSDGIWLEALPFKIINRCIVIDTLKFDKE